MAAWKDGAEDRKIKRLEKLEIKEQRKLDAIKRKEALHKALFAKKRQKLGVEPEPEPQPEPVKKPVFGLCLGGGGARGFAHIGAFKAFSEAGIDFDIVAGTSVGSLMGALYCAGIDIDHMIEYAAAVDKKSIRKGPIWSPDDSSKIGKIVTDLIGDIEFKDLKKPFYAVAVNLITGKEIVIDRGRIADAVAASCTVPLFYKPYVHNGMHLVDGGLLNNIPADVCRMMGADKVITVDVNPTRGGGTSETGIISVLKATFSIMGANASLNGLVNSDVVIAPDMSKFKAADKEGYDEMIELGYRATLRKLDEVRKIMGTGADISQP